MSWWRVILHTHVRTSRQLCFWPWYRPYGAACSFTPKASAYLLHGLESLRCCMQDVHDCAPAGLVGEDKASGRRSLGPSSSMIGPESIGLPADDTFNYLALLKR